MELVGEQENRYVIHVYKSLRSLPNEVPVYEVQLEIEGQAKHRLLEDDVHTRTFKTCRLHKRLEDHSSFIRKSVYQRLSCNWIHIEFRLDRLEKLLQNDHLEIMVEKEDCSIRLKTVQSGSISYKRKRLTVQVERMESKNPEVDLFDCVDVRFTKGLEFEHIYHETAVLG